MATNPSGDNHERLGSFVDRVIGRASALPQAPAAALLRVNADLLRRHLGALADWASREPPVPCPSHLDGLSAFDLSDAAEALEAEAARRERPAALDRA
jgi:hypothetical protein